MTVKSEEKWKERFYWLSMKIHDAAEEVAFNRAWEKFPPEEKCESTSDTFYISNDLDYVVDNESKARELWGDRYIKVMRVYQPKDDE